MKKRLLPSRRGMLPKLKKWEEPDYLAKTTKIQTIQLKLLIREVKERIHLW